MDALLGILALVVGLLLCFRGAVAMRVVLAVWGGLAGFGLGASIGAGVSGGEVLGDAASWIPAILLALLFAALAFVFYVLAVALAIGSAGYALAAFGAQAAGLEGTAVVIIGVIGAVLLAVIALALRVPMLLLAVLSALIGAGLVLTAAGLLLQAGGVELPVTPWTSLAALVLAVVGFVVQVRSGTVTGRARSRWTGRRTEAAPSGA